jgi:hypothetical protein
MFSIWPCGIQDPFHFSDKPVAPPTECFNVSRLACIIRQDGSEFIDGLIEAVIVVYVHAIRPQQVPEFLTCYGIPGTIQQAS